MEVTDLKVGNTYMFGPISDDYVETEMTRPKIGFSYSHEGFFIKEVIEFIQMTRARQFRVMYFENIDIGNARVPNPKRSAIIELFLPNGARYDWFEYQTHGPPNDDGTRPIEIRPIQIIQLPQINEGIDKAELDKQRRHRVFEALKPADASIEPQHGPILNNILGFADITSPPKKINELAPLPAKVYSKRDSNWVTAGRKTKRRKHQYRPGPAALRKRPLRTNRNL